MKYLLKFLLILISILYFWSLFTGCNVSDPVVEGNDVRLNLHGKILNGETGEGVTDAVISIHSSERYDIAHQDSGTLEIMKMSTGDTGMYSIEGTIRHCNNDETAGYIKAATTDAVGRYLSQTAAFECTDSLQSINLVLRQTKAYRYLIIK